MKKIKSPLIILSVCTLVSSTRAGNVTVSDALEPLPPGSVLLQGRLGDSLRLSIANRLKKIDYAHLVEPFRLRNERDGKWRCEFWGKIVRSSIQSWRGVPDPELLTMIKATVEDLISTQTPDGCISSYPAELQTKDWDIWGRKYVLIGLARYYLEIEQSEVVKTAMTRELDYLISQVGPGANNIVDCGHQAGLAASSVLEPVVLTYRITGEKRFLDYAIWIAAQGGSSANNIYTSILQGVPPRKLGNGKAYEMMSCFEGLAELYRETGAPDQKESILAFYRAVRDQEIFITGVGGLKDSWGEFWDNGKIKQTQVNVGSLGETCVTTTWVKFCGQVLRLTGDSTVADEMERALYNGVLGAMLPDASWWMHCNPTPLAGPSSKNRAGDQIHGYGEDCCLAQGPRALAVAPWMAVMKDAGGPVINLYEPTEASFALASGMSVKLAIEGNYPVSGDVRVTVNPANPGKFQIKLRIPAWSQKTTVSVNGQDYAGMPGTYLNLERDWKPNDVIHIKFDLRVQVNEAPDGGGRVALTYGPVVLAQDSRLGKVDVPVSTDQLEACVVEQNSRKEMSMLFHLADGTTLCDYASAGNEFSPRNQLCVWMKQVIGSEPAGSLVTIMADDPRITTVDGLREGKWCGALWTSFQGPSVKLIGSTGPSGGLADIFVDGLYQKTVDWYSDSDVSNVTVFAAGNLPDGKHLLGVLTRGAQRADSKGTSINWSRIEFVAGSHPERFVPVKRTRFDPNVPLWLDDRGVPLQCHMGGIMAHQGKYYMVGSDWRGEKLPGYLYDWGKNEGLCIYSSPDLMNWTYHGNYCQPSSDPTHPLHDYTLGVARSKLLYAKGTGKFVALFQVMDNSFTKINVTAAAVADKPEGPYHWHGILQYDGKPLQGADTAVFTDDDGTQYLITGARTPKWNVADCLYQLTPDCLAVEKAKVLGTGGEAPAIFKHEGVYYLLHSGLTGLNVNDNFYHTATNIWGPWVAKGTIATGEHSGNTFLTQTTDVVPVTGKKGAFIWIGDSLRNSAPPYARTVWLPVTIKGKGEMEIRWRDNWDLSVFDK